jgi:RNA polymerase sigma-70 factor (ECF subfamily)
MGEQAGQRGGERDGFAELVERSEPGLRRLLRRACGRAADVDDLLQETYLRAWRGFGRFRGESRPTTWIMRIALNASRNWRRSQRPTVPLTAVAEAAPAAGPVVGEAAIRDAYERALARLSPEQRLVFVLHEAEGLSYRDVADAIGCPVGTVMSRLHRARARLLEELGDRIEEIIP